MNTITSNRYISTDTITSTTYSRPYWSNYWICAKHNIYVYLGQNCMYCEQESRSLIGARSNEDVIREEINKRMDSLTNVIIERLKEIEKKIGELEERQKILRLRIS